MKLISCYIENFGGLQKFSYDFNEGINVILEENGWGKSTLATFLKAMFYGLDRTTKRSLDENERKKYEPWNGGIYGGNLIFEENGNVYRIERLFGIKDKEDTFVLYDVSTGLESDIYTERIGEELFGIDRVAFEQSVFMKQGMYAVTMTDSIATKMSGLMASGDDMDCYEKACARIDAEMKIYKKIGNKGKIPELADEIAALNRKLTEGKQIQDSLEEWDAKKKQSLRERDDLLRQKEELKKLILKAAEQNGLKEKRKYYDALLKEKEELEQSVKKLDAFFQNGVPEEEELEQYRNKMFLFNRVDEEVAPEMQSYRYPDIAEVLKHCPITEEELDACEKKWNDVREKEVLLEKKRLHIQAIQMREDEKKKQREEEIRNTKTRKYIFFCLAALAVVLAIVLYFLVGIIPCCISALVGVICLLAAVIYVFHNQKLVGVSQDENEELYCEKNACSELEDSIKNTKKAVCMYLHAFMCSADADFSGCMNKIRITLMEEKSVNEHSRQKQIQKEMQQREKEILKDELIVFLHRFYPENTLVEECLLKEIMQKRNEYINVGQQYEVKCAQLEQTEEVDDISDEDILSMEKLQQDERNLEQKISATESYLSQINQTIAQYAQILEECEKLEMEKHDLEELLSEYTGKYKLLEKTLKYLKNAQTEFSTRYLKKMNEGFSKYATLFRKDAFERSELDIKLSVKSDEGGVKRDLGFYSTGMREAMELCTRFALIDALFEKEHPFVVLDDPFVNMDEKSLKGAKEVLLQIADRYQLIYFTCHPSRQ